MASLWLMVGTAKGLFRFESDDGRRWTAREPALVGTPIYACAYAADTNTLFSGSNSTWYGHGVLRSRDLGQTWDTGGSGLDYSAEDPEKVSAVWSIRPLGSGRVYAGVEASGLFLSEDNGDTWQEVASLRQHPTHETWGAGNGGKCLHTIVPDPFDARRLYIACSTGGVYRTDDAGASWRPLNRNVRLEHVPQEMLYAESGQCAHKLMLTPARQGRAWLQSHSGIYRSDDGGETWQAVDQALPSDFGFPIVAHPKDADCAYTIPLASDGARWFAAEKMGVYRTKDGGQSWQPLRNGLTEPSHSVVLRDAFTSDGGSPLGLCFGTTAGGLYLSRDEGESWQRIAAELPRILSVTWITA